MCEGKSLESEPRPAARLCSQSVPSVKFTGRLTPQPSQILTVAGRDKQLGSEGSYSPVCWVAK